MNFEQFLGSFKPEDGEGQWRYTEKELEKADGNKAPLDQFLGECTRLVDGVGMGVHFWPPWMNARSCAFSILSAKPSSLASRID